MKNTFNTTEDKVNSALATLKNKPYLKEFNEDREFYDETSEEYWSAPGETETPQGLPSPTVVSRQVSYEEVEEQVETFLPNSATALKLVLAVAISAYYHNPLMLWFLLVAAPSSGKTELVKLLKGVTDVYFLDNITLNAFISGERPTEKDKVYDLLPLLDKKCWVIKDWTSILALDEKQTKKLLGDLVGIYDKEFTKFSSRRGQVSYESIFSHIGCITPATLNKHTNYINMVGPRFLFYVMPDLTEDQENESFDKIFSNHDRSEQESKAKELIAIYIMQLRQYDKTTIKSLSKEVEYYLKIASKLMANCRGTVITQPTSFMNDEGQRVSYYETAEVQIEKPWRAVKQLIELSTYLAFVTGKDEVGSEEMRIIKDVVMSSMPADRSKALRTVKDNLGVIKIQDLAKQSQVSTKTSNRLLDELSSLKVLDKTKGMGTTANVYTINSKYKDFILLDPAEFMSNYKQTLIKQQSLIDDEPPF